MKLQKKRRRARNFGRGHIIALCSFVCLVVVTTVIAAIIAASVVSAAAATIEDQERTARELNAELAHLGSSSDPLEREALLLRIMRECPNADEGIAAYWALSDLYLNDFDEPDEKRARDILELCLKNYPSSRWSIQVKTRLLVLCEHGDSKRASQLRKELLKDGELPNIIRITMK